MPLTDAEELRLSEYFELYGIKPSRQERVRTIARMSSNGHSIKEIYAEVKGSMVDLIEHRSKLRRWGVW
jgi:hypothetical protein